MNTKILNKEDKKEIIDNTHFFKIKDELFLFDISTTSVFEIDDIVYNNIENIKKDPNLDVEDEDLLDYLSEGYFLGSNNRDEFFKKKNNRRYLTSLELNLIHSCNMNCRYCYGDGGVYGSENTVMSKEVAKEAVDYLIFNSGDIETLSIVFFGGEPLMNFAVIEYVVDYCNSEKISNTGKSFTYSLTTNGTINNSKIRKFLDEYKVAVLISMDGNQEQQNYLRPLRSGDDSFNKIKENLQDFHRKKRRSVRATITRRNSEYEELIKTFQSLDFRRCILMPVETDDKDLMLDKESLQKILCFYNNYIDELIREIDNNIFPTIYIKNVEDTLLSLYQSKKKYYPCGAIKNFLSVSPNGELFTCHRFVDCDKHNFGNIRDLDSYFYEHIKLKDYVSSDINCEKCWLRNVCGGGCIQSRELTGTEDRIDCMIMKHIYERTIRLYSRIMNNETVREKFEDRFNKSNS